MIMSQGVIILRRATTADVTTNGAHPEMNPCVTKLDTRVTQICVRLHYLNLIEIAARFLSDLSGPGDPEKNIEYF